MKKPLILTAVSALLGGTIPMVSRPISNQMTKIQTNQIINDGQLIDFDALNQKVALDVLKQNFPDKTITNVTNVTAINLNVFNVKGAITGTTSTETPQALFMGENILDNSAGDTDQVLKTSSYQKEVTNQTAHTVTHGITISAKATIDVFNINLDYNFSDSKTDTQITTITVNSPIQQIILPAHKKMLVKTYLGQNDTKVNLDLDATLNATIHGNYKIDNSNITYDFDFPLALAYEQYSLNNQLPSGISVDMINQLVSFHGLADAENVSESNIYSVSIEEV
ncbi:ETX/MTX2 family pore-forming toxin [Spiroplasma endosymbiont of Stenodema calcarata]|uniref:ETX/MTX2 family pore-forming toxin n=1 Tax=Spiroplasma endosymbiont of Stenodema calcarata TaxID=3139328 RepID=UPI003CCB295C